MPVRAVMPGAADSPAVPLRVRPTAWMVRADRIVDPLPMSVAVLDRGEIVYAHGGDVPRTPASNEKLLLSMALLARFGAAYRVPTTAEGPLPVRGSLRGDLWLVGHGDPEVDGSALRKLALAVRSAGIRDVRGSVVGVTSTFTRERWARGWERIALHYIGLPTALTYDANEGPGGFVFDPERRAAAAFTADLRALGIRVAGEARAGPAPPRRRVLAAIRSAPLADILRRQNQSSLNLDAEVLDKMLGGSVYGPPGSIAKGARAIASWVRARGVPAVVRDGSGLSYGNRITADGMVRLLSAMRSGPLRSTLPAPGQGPLAGRMAGITVRAKTGTLIKRVSALSGWVWLPSPARWAAFSVLSRGLSKAAAVSVEDRIVRLVATEAR